MKFTIDRSKWRCGGSAAAKGKRLTAKGKGFTRLLNPEGYMCCLGMVARQLDIPEANIENQRTPSGVFQLFGSILASKTGYETPLAREAMKRNDDASLSQHDRESSLAASFAKYGHEIEFVGEFEEPECDHEWEVVDDSFDHEYGCEQIIFERCSVCDEEREYEPPQFDDDVI